MKINLTIKSFDCIADVEAHTVLIDDSFSHEFGTEVIMYREWELEEINWITTEIDDDVLYLDCDRYRDDVIHALNQLPTEC